jgi:hypothetical protein
VIEMKVFERYRRDMGAARKRIGAPGAVEEREMLPLTLNLGHSVIDGATAARFATTFRLLPESAAVMDDPRWRTPSERSAKLRPAGCEAAGGRLAS